MLAARAYCNYYGAPRQSAATLGIHQTSSEELRVGLFWDLYQQSQISEQADRSTSTDARVERLESEVQRLSDLLHQVIGRLEKHVGVDLDQDGRIG